MGASRPRWRRLAVGGRIRFGSWARKTRTGASGSARVQLTASHRRVEHAGETPQHSSIRTGDVVVLLRSSEHTEGEVVVTLPDGRYKVKWATGAGYRDRITTVAADDICKKV
jgi:hypothetical protein